MHKNAIMEGFIPFWIMISTLLVTVTESANPCLRACNGITATCYFNFTVEWHNTMTIACGDCPKVASDCSLPSCVAANGVDRAIVTVNQQIPGPIIEVCHNDTIVVNVENRLMGSDGISIHWHGILQNGTPYMDGANMLTQCPIPPQSSFQYRFLADHSGTFFWHAHSGMQRADGMFGPLIVRAIDDPHKQLYDFDSSEQVVIVNDWLDNLSIQELARNAENAHEGTPAAILINGRGRRRSPELNTTTPFTRLTVKRGYRYRFRFISNGILHCPIQISIDGHNLTMIAADGNPFEPIEVESFTIFAGERYDFVVRTDRAMDNYWVKAKGLADCATNNLYELAILSYNGARNGEPAAPVTYETAGREGKAFNPFNKAPSDSNIRLTAVKGLNNDLESIKGTPDFKKYIVLDQEKVDDEDGQIMRENVNLITNRHPPSPLLYQYNEIPKSMFCNQDNVQTRNCSFNKCDCIHLHEIKLGQLVEIVLIGADNEDAINHPVHLHGYDFYVVAQEMMNSNATADVIKAMDASGAIPRNLITPVRKDTISLSSGGYIVMRFRADNPGIWFFHCHLEFHMEGGMSLVLKVGEPNQWPKEPPQWPHCGGAWNLRSLTPAKNTAMISKASIASLFVMLLICML